MLVTKDIDNIILAGLFKSLYMTRDTYFLVEASPLSPLQVGLESTTMEYSVY